MGPLAAGGVAEASHCCCWTSSRRRKRRHVRRDTGGRPAAPDHARRERRWPNQIVFEPREISQSGDVTVEYHTGLDPRTSLEDLCVS